MTAQFGFRQLVELCERTHEELQGQVVRVASRSLAARNWLFGWYIVEYEQSGADRAEYGERLIPRLSKTLASSIGRGFSERNLDQFRKFYRAYREIPQTVSAELAKAFRLGWSHYVELPTVGIVLCHRKNEALVELTLPDDANIFASKYQLYLPSKEELKHQLVLAGADLEERRS